MNTRSKIRKLIRVHSFKIRWKNLTKIMKSFFQRQRNRLVIVIRGKINSSFLKPLLTTVIGIQVRLTFKAYLKVNPSHYVKLDQVTLKSYQLGQDLSLKRNHFIRTNTVYAIHRLHQPESHHRMPMVKMIISRRRRKRWCRYR